MIYGELSFGSPTFLHVTWKIPDFLQTARESGYSLQSPEFPFADDRYCLRLFRCKAARPGMFARTYVCIELVNLTHTVPGRDVSYEFGLKGRTGEEIDIPFRRVPSKRVLCILQRDLKDERDLYFPDGTLTVFCSVRLKEPRIAGSPEFSSAQIDTLANSIVRRLNCTRNFRMSGELFLESPPLLQVTWKIPYFFQMARETDFSLESPEFPFADGRYHLLLFRTSDFEMERVRIELVNLTATVPGTDVSYEAVLKSRTGEEIHIGRIIRIPRIPEPLLRMLTFGKGRSHDIVSFFIEPRLLEELDSYFCDGTLTLFYFVRLRKPSSAEDSKSSGAEISDEEEEQKGLTGAVKLLSDYRQLLKKGTESDACLVVSGKEFRAHKIILRSRSPVFEAMFHHEAAEKNSGRVVIEDLDPESFGDFLEYLYTGVVEAGLSDDNAFWLYAAADKYDVPTLKSECLAHMRRNLSVDSFCDVITLALRHQGEELWTQAVMFFKENMARIIVTDKWQQFVIDNGTSANELFIKAIVPGEI